MASTKSAALGNQSFRRIWEKDYWLLFVSIQLKLIQQLTSRAVRQLCFSRLMISSASNGILCWNSWIVSKIKTLWYLKSIYGKRLYKDSISCKKILIAWRYEFYKSTSYDTSANWKIWQESGMQKKSTWSNVSYSNTYFFFAYTLFAELIYIVVRYAFLTFQFKNCHNSRTTWRKQQGRSFQYEYYTSQKFSFRSSY